MRAVVCEARGGPETLRLREVPDPSPEPGEALLRVEAAGVNYADLMMRRGLYPGSPEPPFVPGFEVCGTVLDSGPGGDPTWVGRRVVGILMPPRASGYAEQTVAPINALIPLPAGLSPEEGAAFGVVFLTAYGVLRVVAKIQPGEWVLVHAAGGGVGTAAVQLAHHWGARVIATASSDEKLARVRELGADVTINYRATDFREGVRQATEGRGVDVALESVGGDVFRQSLEVLAPLGRLVVFGIATAEPNTVETPSLLFHTWGVLGFHMNALMRQPVLLARAVEEVGGMLNRGEIRPIVGHRMPLDQAAEAHRLMEQRESYGKIVLVPSG